MTLFAQLETEQIGSQMQYDINHINSAIIRVLGELSYGVAPKSAKDLEGIISHFFFISTNWRDGKPKRDFPQGYCYPWRADIDSLKKMCGAIKECILMSSSDGYCQILLISRIIEVSEELMAKFRQYCDGGIYFYNPAHVRELDDKSDWGRWMLALKATFIESKKFST